MRKSLKDLKALVAEIEETNVRVIAIEGLEELPALRIEINGIDGLRYPFHIRNLYNSVIEGKVLQSFKNRKRLEHWLRAAKEDFSVIQNYYFDPIENPRVAFNIRKSLHISYCETSKKLLSNETSNDKLQWVVQSMDISLNELIDIINALIYELNIKVPVPRMEGCYSFEYRGNPTSDKLRQLHDVLLGEKRIKDIQWNHFRRAFSRDTKTEVEVKIVWLVGVSELKKLIDTLIDSNQFNAKKNKWKVASYCITINERPSFDWSTMRSQKYPTFTPSYIEEIKTVFSS